MTITEIPEGQYRVKQSGASGPPATVGPRAVQGYTGGGSGGSMLGVGCLMLLFVAMGLFGFLLLLSEVLR